MKRVFTKHFLLLLLFFIACGHAYTTLACGNPSFRQGEWRWRHNNGSETSATWMAAQNVSGFYNGPGTVLRLRIEIINTTTREDALGNCLTPASGVLYSDTLQYTTTPTAAASWISITNSPANAFVMAGSASSFVQQGEPTTAQLATNNSNAFVAGKVVADVGIINLRLPPNGSTEFEWVITGTANTAAGTTYYFRQKRAPIYSYTAMVYPLVTTASLAPLPVKLIRFSVGKEGGRVRIEWTTATEEASDRFEILRSADGRNWQTLTQVQSVGNATSPTDYSAHDDRPLSGLNYYRLKQVDKDGKSAFSDVKSVRLFTDVTVSVWPNPASAYLNFSLQQAEAQVMVTLQDATGRTVQQERFSHLQAGAVSKWALPQKMPAGVYVLKLKGDDFSETRKVVIQ